MRALVAGIFALLLFVFLIFRAFFPGMLDLLASPLWSAGSFATDALRQDPSASVEELSLRVAELENENLLLRERLQDVGAERELPSDTGLLAGVKARPPVSPYDVLVIDRGEEHGVVYGMVAYALGVPIGSVAETNASSARVVLYSAPERITEGWIGEARTPVTLIGAGAGAFEADVPRESGVLEGDLVYVPGAGALPLGRVEQIEAHASSPRSQLRIRPLVNPLALTWVRLSQ